MIKADAGVSFHLEVVRPKRTRKTHTMLLGHKAGQSRMSDLRVGTSVQVVERTAPPLDLSWPSGEGNEVGTVALSIGEVWNRVSENVRDFGRDVSIYEIDDDGYDAIVLHGVAKGPVTLVADEELALGLLSVVADTVVEPKKLMRSLRTLLGLQIAK